MTGGTVYACFKIICTTSDHMQYTQTLNSVIMQVLVTVKLATTGQSTTLLNQLTHPIFQWPIKSSAYHFVKLQSKKIIYRKKTHCNLLAHKACKCWRDVSNFFRQTQMTPAAVTIFRPLTLLYEISLHTKMFNCVRENFFKNLLQKNFSIPGRI